MDMEIAIIVARDLGSSKKNDMRHRGPPMEGPLLCVDQYTLDITSGSWHLSQGPHSIETLSLRAST